MLQHSRRYERVISRHLVDRTQPGAMELIMSPRVRFAMHHARAPPPEPEDEEQEGERQPTEEGDEEPPISEEDAQEVEPTQHDEVEPPQPTQEDQFGAYVIEGWPDA